MAAAESDASGGPSRRWRWRLRRGTRWGVRPGLLVAVGTALVVGRRGDGEARDEAGGSGALHYGGWCLKERGILDQGEN